jgi:hypothetical protein
MPAPAQAGSPGDTATLTVREALDGLDVAEEDTTAYKRSYLRHWIDADHDGCNTLHELLLEEAVIAPEQSAGCKQGLPRDRHQIREDRRFLRSGGHPRIVPALGKIRLKTDPRTLERPPLRPRSTYLDIYARGGCRPSGWQAAVKGSKDRNLDLFWVYA